MKFFSLCVFLKILITSQDEKVSEGHEESSDHNKTVLENVLTRRQLNFGGNGGGINEYLNGGDSSFVTGDFQGESANNRREMDWNVCEKSSFIFLLF